MDWLDENQRALTAELERIAGYLERRTDTGSTASARSPALEHLVAAFGLTAFERDVLLLCAGVELEARFGDLCARAACDEALRRPTFGLALACLPDPHWSALTPARPLRYWRLVEPEAGETAAAARLRIDERVLHHLAGLQYLDERLRGAAALAEPPRQLPRSQADTAVQVAAALAAAGEAGPAVVVTGADAETRRAVAVQAAANLGLRAFAVSAADLPAHVEERATGARLWERELALSAGLLLVELDDEPEGEHSRRTASFVDELSAAVVVGCDEPARLGRRIAARIEVSRPTPAEQRLVWRELLGARGVSLNGSLDALVAHFDLPLDAIVAAEAQATASGEPLERAVWSACRAQARPRLDDLAQRIEAVAGWDDLVLPAAQLDTLREIAAQVRHRRRVHDEWGFARKSARGLGISALFEGPSGTGKTMAAEVLARELDLDLYRIDLSQVVSKYIGETEKNLRRVFDAADTGGVVLLFDEADALFGKRTAVKDSHDRYANIEISYLLQRMEAYRGLAILTTNARDAVDDAFMRRIRFLVSFPFPDAAERAEIWRRTIPAETPAEALEPNVLATLNVAGGSIRNIALAAAFLAADEREPLRMGHLARAAARECAKIERPLTEAEVRAWQ
jgi:hypothetical protein